MNSQFMGYLKENYFNVTGRATAREYWHFNVQIALHVALAFLLFACLESISLRLRGTDLHLPITVWLGSAGFVVASVLLIVPLTALSVRRLHDMSLSGWWLLLPIALAAALGPYKWAVSIAVTLFLLQRGVWSSNKFGPEPDFDATQYQTAIQHLWHATLPVKSAAGACLAGLIVFGFFLPITGVSPTERANGLTEYQLIDRNTDARWVLLFAGDTTVTRPESEHYLGPSIGGRRPVARTNQTLTLSLSRDDIALGDADTPFVDVTLRAQHQQTSHRSFGSDHRDRCHRGQEIAPGVFAMVDVPQSEAELLYEVGSQTKSFQKYYDTQFANRCVRPDGPFASRYIVTDSTGQIIGYGNCFTRNTNCRFSFENPFGRPAYYDLDVSDVANIANVHDGVLRYLIAATDRDTSKGFTIPDMGAPDQEPLNLAEYVPSPLFSAFEIDPATVPSDGFRQVVFDSASPNVVTRDTNVARIAINASRQGFSGVAVDHIAAYWVGKRTFAEPTRQMISLDVAQALAVVRINGDIVYRYRPRTVTGSDIQDALRDPVYQNGDVKLAIVSTGPRPENPFVIEFPAGDSIIEVEFINDFHVAEFMLTIGDEVTPLTRNETRDRLASANLQDADVYYFGVYESSRPDGRITIRLPDTLRPAVLVLDSHDSVTWEIESDREIVSTIVGSTSSAVQLIGGDFGDIIHLNDPFRMHDETRDCDCQRSRFRCDSNEDLVDVASAVHDLIGVPLVGFAMDYDIGLMTATDYTPRVEDRIKQLRDEYAALQETCD